MEYIINKRIKELFDDLQNHDKLIEVGVKIAKGLGFTKISREVCIDSEGVGSWCKNFVIDVYGENEETGENIGIECGTLSEKNENAKVRRLLFLSLTLDNFIWLPYFTHPNNEFALLDPVNEVNVLISNIDSLQKDVLKLSVTKKRLEERIGVLNRLLYNFQNVYDEFNALKKSIEAGER